MAAGGDGKEQAVNGDLFGYDNISLQAQIDCVSREIRMRVKVYSRRVIDGSMSGETAEREIAAMQAVKRTLESLKSVRWVG